MFAGTSKDFSRRWMKLNVDFPSVLAYTEVEIAVNHTRFHVTPISAGKLHLSAIRSGNLIHAYSAIEKGMGQFSPTQPHKEL